MKKLLFLLALLIPTVALAQAPSSSIYAKQSGAWTNACTQSGTWNVGITGTVSLPTGAATESTLSTLNGKVTAVNTGAVVVSTSALPTGASTSAKQPTLGTAGTPSTDVLTVQGAASMTALKTDASATTQPVSGTVAATQSGTWTVQPGNTANTTAWKVDGSAVTQPVSGTLTTQSTDATATGSITTQNLVPAGTATVGSAVEISLNGQPNVSVQVTGTYTGALSVQATVDGTNWITLSGLPFININTGAYSATITSAAAGIFQIPNAGFQKLRITGLAAMTGTATITERASRGTGLVALSNPIPTGANVIGALSANQSTNVAQINGVAPLMGNGVTGTGSPRVTLSSDATANANFGQVASGSAPPTGLTMAGAVSSNVAAKIYVADAYAIINMTTATTTQVVALTASQRILITGWDFMSNGTGNIKFVYGTGTNCGTGTTDATKDYPLIANIGMTKGSGVGVMVFIPSGNALCVTTSAAVTINGTVSYTKAT